MGVGGPGSRSPREIAMIAIDNLIQVLLIQAVCSHSYTLPESLSHTLVLHILRKQNGRAHTHMPTVTKPTNLHTLYSYKTSLLLHGTLQILQIRANIYQTLKTWKTTLSYNTYNPTTQTATTHYEPPIQTAVILCSTIAFVVRILCGTIAFLFVK